MQVGEGPQLCKCETLRLYSDLRVVSNEGEFIHLDLTIIRNQFPSLNRLAIFFDNPGGTQIAKQSLERIKKYLLECNANHESAFATSIASGAILNFEKLRGSQSLQEQ